MGGSAVDDDVASVSTTDIAVMVPKAVDDTVLHVDWSAAQPPNSAMPLETVQESAELEVDWNDHAEETGETRWSAEMVDAITGVRAEWHWVSTPCHMLTCGNLRAHIKNTFVDRIYDCNELPAVAAR